MNTITSSDLLRIDNDADGTPRYVIHFLWVASDYDTALYLAKKSGGKKYHNKKYGGGIAFASYSTERVIEIINNLINI